MPRASQAVFDARNRVMARLYLEHEWTLSDLADAFDMGVPNAHRILKRLGATLPPGERRRRFTKANRIKAANPEFRAQMSASIREIWAIGKGSGRSKLFEDNPERRTEYLRLQKKVGAAEARRILAEHDAGRRAA